MRTLVETQPFEKSDGAPPGGLTDEQKVIESLVKTATKLGMTPEDLRLFLSTGDEYTLEQAALSLTKNKDAKSGFKKLRKILKPTLESDEEI